MKNREPGHYVVRLRNGHTTVGYYRGPVHDDGSENTLPWEIIGSDEIYCEGDDGLHAVIKSVGRRVDRVRPTEFEALDTDRIDRMLNLLRKYWNMYPDMRLGQIVANIADGDAFYYRDGEIESYLRAATVTAPGD